MSVLEGIGAVSITLASAAIIVGVIYLIDKFSKLFSDVKHLIEMRDLTAKALDEQSSMIADLSCRVYELESVKKGKK
jgi:hypothetical protein